MNNTKRIMAVGKVVVDFGAIIVTEEDVLGSVAWAEFIEGVNSAIRGADLEEMTTADEVSGWWYHRRYIGAKPLTDSEIEAEAQDLEADMLDREDWSRGQW